MVIKQYLLTSKALDNRAMIQHTVQSWAGPAEGEERLWGSLMVSVPLTVIQAWTLETAGRRDWGWGLSAFWYKEGSAQTLSCPDSKMDSRGSVRPRPGKSVSLLLMSNLNPCNQPLPESVISEPPDLSWSLMSTSLFSPCVSPHWHPCFYPPFDPVSNLWPTLIKTLLL